MVAPTVVAGLVMVSPSSLVSHPVEVAFVVVEASDTVLGFRLCAILVVLFSESLRRAYRLRKSEPTYLELGDRLLVFEIDAGS
jgi:hypothetical protein